MRNVVKKIMLITLIATHTYNALAEENDMFVFLKSCFSTWPSNNITRSRTQKYVIGHWNKGGMGACSHPRYSAIFYIVDQTIDSRRILGWRSIS